MPLLFLSVAILALMTDDTHDMSLTTLLIYRIAHRLAVNRKGFVCIAIHFIPSPEGTIKLGRINTNKQITNDIFAGYNTTSVFPTAGETFPRFGTETFGPVVDCLVATHSAQRRSSGNAQYGRKAMTPSLGTTRVSDAGKKIG